MTAEAKHTPTPWGASNAPDGTGIPGWNIVGSDGWTVCSMMDLHTKAVRTNTVNAAFIVRAVNAHEALVACRDALALAVDALKRGEDADAVLICEGRAALALAEGGGK